MKRTILPLALSSLCWSGLALAQPGMTPPGQTPPYEPAPDPYAPDPYGPDPYAPDPYGPPPPAAQTQYGPPMAPLPPRERSGWHLGISLGLGGMSANGESLDCGNCSGDPPAAAFDLHVGTLLSPSFALQGELWTQGKMIDEIAGRQVSQTMMMVAGQFWLGERFWLKAGLGLASVSETDDRQERVAAGTAFMAGAGYELYHSRNFGCDIQLKTGAGSYQGDTLSSTTIGLGLNWY